MSNAENGFIEAIAEAVAARLGGELSRPTIDLSEMGIQPMQVYSVKAAATLLDCSEDALRKISDTELPKVRRVGTGIGYLGINIMLYSHSLPPIDMTRVLQEYRSALLHDRPAVLPMEEQRITRVH